MLWIITCKMQKKSYYIYNKSSQCGRAFYYMTIYKMKLDWKSIQQAIHSLIEEYKFAPTQVLDIVKLWIKSAFRKDYLEANKKVQFQVSIDRDGNIKVFREFMVVSELTDDNIEMNIKDALKLKKDIKEWDIIYIDITPERLEFSRIAVQAAAQTIKQNLKKIERERFFEKFQDKQWELLKAKVIKTIWDNAVLDVEWTTVILAPEWQIPNRMYTVWEEILVLLKQISKWVGWIVLDITQSSKDFIEILLRKIVPELDDWMVKIDKIVRMPWKRTKVVVYSQDDRIDPVWVFVWQSGHRIMSILSILDWEKIDFIEKTDDDAKLIKDALKPARVNRVIIDGRRAEIEVDDDQRAIAIWKWAVNIKLASQLTWYRLEVL